MSANINEIKKLLKGLSKKDLEELNSEITEQLEKSVGLIDFLDTCAEQRFSEGLVCPYCGKKHIVKFGRARGKQRYRCKDCGKTFNTLTKTIFADSKLSMSTWLKYADCMSKRLSLRKSAEIVGVSLRTSFFMRHKILSALRVDIGVDNLSGVVEMDETFFAESFKGNHKKGNPDWVAPRAGGQSRQRGKQVSYRGISHEQVCVSTAMDRTSGLVVVPACKGRLTIKRLSAIYDGKIEQSSIICTDSHNAYKSFAKSIPADLVQIERGKHKKGLYHINHINSLHSRLKDWVKQFNGFSTKYIANYMYWFNWQERNKSISKYRQSRNVVYESISTPLLMTQPEVCATKPF